ncbi:MAG: hypothetical protein QOI89_3667 [Solirubrobacteraceae bacterium]|jgi:hypothetical protein|nr:hypothetical protein [Solirubrobacteraceae bacterium]
MVIPDTARTELATALDAYTTAAPWPGGPSLSGRGAWWWPALVIAAVTGITAWIRARAAPRSRGDYRAHRD